MIIENSTNFDLRSRWNRYMNQETLDIRIDGQWVALGSLLPGEQRFEYGIKAVTTLPLSPQRSDCDLQNAQTVLSEDC